MLCALCQSFSHPLSHDQRIAPPTNNTLVEVIRQGLECLTVQSMCLTGACVAAVKMGIVIDAKKKV